MKPLQFSYSFLNQYDSCPERARHQYVLRSYKSEYKPGIDIHKAMENRFRYGEALPDELKHVEPMAVSLANAGKPECEVSFAVNRDLKKVGFWDGWLRGKYDIVMRWPEKRRASVFDWKSGKVKETVEQLEIGALLLFANDPAIDEVHGANLWIGQGQAKLGVPYHFKRTDSRWPKWLARMTTIEKLDRNEPWEKRESGLCGWCPVKVCQHYKGA